MGVSLITCDVKLVYALEFLGAQFIPTQSSTFIDREVDHELFKYVLHKRFFIMDVFDDEFLPVDFIRL